METNQTLQEFVDSRGVDMRVERQSGIIRGVKILGLTSRNGRTYLPEALDKAARLYENAKVNVNHPKGSPLGPRDYQDRIGVIRSVVSRPGEGLFADLHFNPKHALAEQLIWDAEHAPENVGFSHNVQAKTTRRGDRVAVEGITKVQSVDLVADPATTRGLFESAAPIPQENATDKSDKVPTALFTELTVDDLRNHRPDLIEALAAEQAKQLAALEARIDRFEAAEAADLKRREIRKLLAEFRLPDPDTATGWEKSAVSDRFIESLLTAQSEEAMRQLVEDRAHLLHQRGGLLGSRTGARPLSRDQHQVDGPGQIGARTFVESIT